MLDTLASALPVHCPPATLPRMFSCADISKPTQPAAIPEDQQPRSRPLRVTGRLRFAIEAMAWQGLRVIDAAAKAGLQPNALYSALKKPHVLQHYNGLLQVLRTGERARNIHRLADIRDAGDNMPAVNAIKLLEQLDETTNTRAGSSLSQVPGFTIVLQQIVTGEPMGHVISVDATNKPAISTGSVPLVGECRSGDESE